MEAEVSQGRDVRVLTKICMVNEGVYVLACAQKVPSKGVDAVSSFGKAKDAKEAREKKQFSNGDISAASLLLTFLRAV